MFYANGYDKGSKTTRLAQWKQVEKGGYTPEGLRNMPEFPDKLMYLWSIYIQIKTGCDRVTFQEIYAYQQMLGMLTPREVEVIIELDQLRMKHG